MTAALLASVRSADLDAVTTLADEVRAALFAAPDLARLEKLRGDLNALRRAWRGYRALDPKSEV